MVTISAALGRGQGGTVGPEKGVRGKSHFASF